MKILDRILIIIFTMCLTIVAIWFSAVPIAKSKAYYHLQFKVNNVYAHENKDGEKEETVFNFLNGEYQRAKFTDEQLDIMVDHIVEFLFGNKESFELELTNVRVYNSLTREYEVVCDDEGNPVPVSIFGEEAVTHMDDVKQLFILFQIISVIAFVLALGIFAYLLLRISQVKKILFEYSMLFHIGLITVLSGFLSISFVGTVLRYGTNIDVDKFFYVAWQYFHIFFFPFQPDKINGSFFNDILTEILTVDLFVAAVFICVFVLTAIQFVWLVFCLILKIFGGQIGNKIKRYQYSNPIPAPVQDRTQNH